MFAGTDLSQPVQRRFSQFGDVISAGWPSLWAVALAGLSLGFFAWYAVVVPRHHGAIGEAGLIAGILGGVLLATALWAGYSSYFAHRAGITLVRSLRYDALTWLPFLLLWLTFVFASELTHGARLLLIALALSCTAKILIAARFNQTVREVLIDFAATRLAIIVIAELAAVIIG
ncbi:MAG TPA: hypothetical protein VGM99_05600, partial [Candidatus Cybelea sp.]